MALSTEKRTKISEIHTGWTLGSLRLTKAASLSGASTISQIGKPCMAGICSTCDSRALNLRMHALLNELKENGLKGDLVDFMWVELPLILGS